MTLEDRGLGKSNLVNDWHNTIYEIVGTAINADTKEKMVIYKEFNRKTPKLYVMNEEKFCSKLDKMQHPTANQEYRFEYYAVCGMHYDPKFHGGNEWN